MECAPCKQAFTQRAFFYRLWILYEMIWWRLQRSLLGQGSYLKILPKRMKWKDRSKNSLCVPNFYINHWIEYLSGARNKVSSKHCWIRREIAKILNMGFVDGIASVYFIHLLDLTRNSCEKYNYIYALWQESNLPQSRRFHTSNFHLLFEQGKQKKKFEHEKV